MRSFLLFVRNNLIKSQTLRIAFAVSVFLLAQAWFSPELFQVPFTVNGRVFVASRPAEAAVILKDAGFRPGRGRLLDVDGKIIRRGVGPVADIKINGSPGTGKEVITRDTAIDFVPAADVVEETTTSIEDIIKVVTVSGIGEYTTVKEIGTPGRKKVSRGATSGKLISAHNLKEGQSMLVARTDKRPEKVIALTFDDGPNPPFTSQIIKTLQDMYATATFFVIGGKVTLYPEAAREVSASGFPVGNHTFSHNSLDRALEENIAKEIDGASDVMSQIMNVQTPWLRPPYGAISPLFRTVAEAKGYRIIRWNVDSHDWEAASVDEIVSNVTGWVKPDSVILMHDGGGDRANTVQALPRIIQILREQDYAFVTLDQLVKE